MKKYIVLSLASFLVLPTCPKELNIKLESPVLHIFDGTAIGVNADVIELIGLVRREINSILYNKQYTISLQDYCLKDLVAMEQEATNAATLASLDTYLQT